MKQYLELLNHVLEKGVESEDRTGVKTLSVFGYQMRFNLNKGFPLLTTKKVFIKGVILELLWFLKGDTNIKYLKEQDVNIWNAWADEKGDLGKIYGHQWRHWGEERFDQIAWVINEIKTNPNSRRLIVSSWNVSDLDEMALSPCHCFFQFYVRNGKLSCQLYQRSSDCFLGVPFNIASYALLTHMIAKECDLGVGEFIWTSGDTHIYLNHLEQVKTQLERKPARLPELIISEDKGIFDYEGYEFQIINYKPMPAIKASVAV